MMSSVIAMHFIIKDRENIKTRAVSLKLSNLHWKPTQSTLRLVSHRLLKNSMIREKVEQALDKTPRSSNTFGHHMESMAHTVLRASRQLLYCWIKPLVASLVYCGSRIHSISSFLITDLWFWSMHPDLQSQAINDRWSKSVIAIPFPMFPISLAGIGDHETPFWPMKYDGKPAEDTYIKIFGF